MHAPSGTSQCNEAASACDMPKFLQQAHAAGQYLHESQQGCMMALAGGLLHQHLACPVRELSAVLNGVDQLFIVVSALAMAGRAAPFVVDVHRLQALIEHEAKHLQMGDADVGDLVMHWHSQAHHMQAPCGHTGSSGRLHVA